MLLRVAAGHMSALIEGNLGNRSAGSTQGDGAGAAWLHAGGGLRHHTTLALSALSAGSTGDGCPAPAADKDCTLLVVLTPGTDINSFCNSQVTPAPESVNVMEAINMCSLMYGANNRQACCAAYSDLEANSAVKSTEFDAPVSIAPRLDLRP